MTHPCLSVQDSKSIITRLIDAVPTTITEDKWYRKLFGDPVKELRDELMCVDDYETLALVLENVMEWVAGLSDNSEWWSEELRDAWTECAELRQSL